LGKPTIFFDITMLGEKCVTLTGALTAGTIAGSATFNCPDEKLDENPVDSPEFDSYFE